MDNKDNAGSVSSNREEKDSAQILFEYMLELKKKQVTNIYPPNLLK